MRTFFLIAITLLIANNGWASDLSITISDIKNDKGQIALSIFKDKGAFEKTDTSKAVAILTQQSKSGELKATLHNMPAGEYAVSILHDENLDANLNVDKRGFPTEGYAYSNNVGTLALPTFEDAKVAHTTDKNSDIKIKMIYVE